MNRIFLPLIGLLIIASFAPPAFARKKAFDSGSSLSFAEQRQVDHWNTYRERHPELFERKLERNRHVRDLFARADTEPGDSITTPTARTRGGKTKGIRGGKSAKSRGGKRR